MQAGHSTCVLWVLEVCKQRKWLVYGCRDMPGCCYGSDESLTVACASHLLGPTTIHPSRSRQEEERTALERRLKSEFESERAELERTYKQRLQSIRDELEDEEATQKRKMVEATDRLVSEYKKQMEVGGGGRMQGSGQKQGTGKVGGWPGKVAMTRNS